MKTATQGVITCAFGGCAQRVAVPLHFFVIAGDFWYALVLLGNSNASYTGILVVLYADTGTGQALANLVNITEAKWLAAAYSPS